MPNKRAEGQKLIAFPVDEEFERRLNEGLRRNHIANKSQFIRDAIFEKLERLGVDIPLELKQAPIRYGSVPSSVVRGSDQVTEAKKLILSRKAPQKRKL